MHGLRLHLPCVLSTSVPLPERRTPANPTLVLKPKGMQLLVGVVSIEVFFHGLLKIWRIGGEICGWVHFLIPVGDLVAKEMMVTNCRFWLLQPIRAVSLKSLAFWPDLTAVFITFILKKAPKLLEEWEGSSGGFSDVICDAPGVPVMEDGWALLTPLLPQAGAPPRASVGWGPQQGTRLWGWWQLGPAGAVALPWDGTGQGAEVRLQPGAHSQHWMAVLRKFNQVFFLAG